ncbi:MAG: prepilin-type N-terminal cleavage/methylation domain-containing protein [Candidatus Omnitrophica bacterium]|nr:prepilin-type N-terminal cleavage/methylation domain-containing protein [Candidatus Omnitrophota bacterium]
MIFKRKTNRSTNKGFTLVELFLAVSLFGIIMVTIFSTYAAGIRIWRTVKSVELIENRKFILTMEKIRRELYGRIRNMDDEELQFTGDDESVSFPYLNGAQIVVVTYYYNSGKDALMRKEIKFTESLKDKMDKKITKLFDARSVKFSYLYAPSDAGETEDGKEASILGGWVDSFEEKDDGVPKAVKFDMKFKGKEERIEKIIFFP